MKVLENRNTGFFKSSLTYRYPANRNSMIGFDRFMDQCTCISTGIIISKKEKNLALCKIAEKSSIG